MKPSVAVVMAVWNGERFLDETMTGIRGQTLQAFEWIVVDDASTDGTARILAEWVRRDRRLRVIRNDVNLGLAGSLNRGIESTSAAFIARHDADDVSEPARLERQAAHLAAHSDVVMVSCNMVRLDEAGNVVPDRDRTCLNRLMRWHLLFQNNLSGHGQMMFRREAWERAGRYDGRRRNGEDSDLWQRLLDLGEIRVMAECLYRYRFHAQSISSREAEAKARGSVEVQIGAVERRLGLSFSREEIERLRAFWSWTPARRLDGGVRELDWIDATLRRMLERFDAREGARAPAPGGWRVPVARLVARRWIETAVALAGQGKRRAALRASRLAAAWDAVAAFRAGAAVPPAVTEELERARLDSQAAGLRRKIDDERLRAAAAKEEYDVLG